MQGEGRRGKPMGETSEDPNHVVFSVPADHSGTMLHVEGWINDTSDKPPLILVHDLGEFAHKYQEVALAFRAQGYDVYGLDVRGHGDSGKRLGHIPRFQALVNDLLQVVAWVKHKKEKKPVLIGQGLGALIGVYFLRAYRNYLKGAVLASIPLNLKTPVSRFGEFMIRSIAEVAPTMRLPAALCPQFSVDVCGEGIFQKSMYVAGLTERKPPRISANFAKELLRAIGRSKVVFRQIASPTLILWPSEDTICDRKDLEEVLQDHPHRELIEVVNLPDVGHGIFTESEEARKAAMEASLRWLEALPAVKGPGEAAVSHMESLAVSKLPGADPLEW
jgi:alpha-beta hydrolase superfamily lysophospholipase